MEVLSWRLFCNITALKLDDLVVVFVSYSLNIRRPRMVVPEANNPVSTAVMLWECVVQVCTWPSEYGNVLSNRNRNISPVCTTVVCAVVAYRSCLVYDGL